MPHMINPTTKKDNNMPKTVETTVYTLAELEALGNERATERAFAWLSDAINYDWADALEEDANDVGLRLYEYNLEYKHIKIFFNADAITVALRIRGQHRPDTATYAAAQEFIGKEDLYNGINGKITLAEAETEELREAEAEYEEAEREFRAALEKAYLHLLAAEYEYAFSREALRELADANDYTFTADGLRFG